MIVLKILFYLAVWFLISEGIAWLICSMGGLSPDEYDADDIRTLRAGVFMAPAWIPLLLLAVVHHRLLRLAHVLSFGLVTEPDENPMEYIL